MQLFHIIKIYEGINMPAERLHIIISPPSPSLCLYMYVFVNITIYRLPLGCWDAYIVWLCHRHFTYTTWLCTLLLPPLHIPFLPLSYIHPLHTYTQDMYKVCCTVCTSWQLLLSNNKQFRFTRIHVMWCSCQQRMLPHVCRCVHI